MMSRRISYSVAHQFVWYRIAKTGTRTLHSLLGEYVEDYCYITPEQCEIDPGLMISLDRGEIFSFTMVRNPWDRLVSAWADKLHTARSTREKRIKSLGATGVHAALAASDFSAFVEMLPGSQLFNTDVHFKPQARIVEAAEINYTARFENYEQEVRRILDWVGISDNTVTIPRRNATTAVARNLDDWYDAKTRQIVEVLYAEDIERWGYLFR